jgi:hypothetical protein
VGSKQLQLRSVAEAFLCGITSWQDKSQKKKQHRLNVSSLQVYAIATLIFIELLILFYLIVLFETAIKENSLFFDLKDLRMHGIVLYKYKSIGS